MRIMDFLHEQAVSCNFQSHNKDGILSEMVELLVKSGVVQAKDTNNILKILHDREALGSTGIGQGVAIPHGKTNCVQSLIGAFGVSKAGIDFGSLDGERSHLFFLLMAPEDSAGPHLKALARISRLLKDRIFRERLQQAPSETALLKILAEEDQRRQ